MATTFLTGFKNAMLSRLTGVSVAYYVFGSANFGTSQPADPSGGAGSTVFSSAGQMPNIQAANWTVADNTATAYLSQAQAPVTPASAAAVTGLTFMRIMDTYGSYGIIDTPIGLTAAPGVGAVVNTLNSSAGVGVTVMAMSFQMPRFNGVTLYLSLTLAQCLVDMATGKSSVFPYMGINTNGACTVTVYSGTVPADADASITTQTPLCVFTCGASNIWGTASGGSLPMNGTLTSAPATATGTATFARMVKVNTTTGKTYVIQGSVGGPGTDFVIGTTSVVSGNSYPLTDAVITM